MQINIKVPKIFSNYAQILRTEYFGSSATSKEYRDSYVFSKAIDNFNDQPEILYNYIKNEQNLNNQKMITIKQNTYDKLVYLSKTLDCTIAAVYRGIIIYTIQTNSYTSVFQSDLEIKVSLLEEQLSNCQDTLSQIKDFLIKQKGL